MTKIATYVGPGHSDRADQRIYRLDPPISWIDLFADRTRTSEYVVVSAVDHSFATETYIFPSDKEGTITNWGELDGSFKGGVDHERALRRAGYEVAS